MTKILIDAVTRIAKELEHYNPKADEYQGEHIHKVWSRELRAALAAAPDDEIKHIADSADELKAAYNVIAARDRHIDALEAERDALRAELEAFDKAEDA